ncbi:MAG TPA: transglutaminase [Clostridiales bacterium]|nr:transglutaminase [Clostridiales bacterium]
MKQKQNTVLLFLIVIVLALIIVLLFTQFRTKVKESITIEAGSEMVNVKDFLINKNNNAEIISDLTELDLKTPGKYDIKIKVKNKEYKSILEIVDTIAPKATAKNLISPKGKTIDAANFVTEIADATAVRVNYKVKPDFSRLGTQEVTVTVEDSGNNRTDLAVVLIILNIRQSVQIEAGSQMNITPEIFLLEDNFSVAFENDISMLDINKPAIHEIQLNVDGNLLSVNIEVIDTTPPNATICNQNTWTGEAIEASSFIIDITDASSVTAYYKETPDFNKLGNQEVTIVLEDESKNKAENKAVLTVKEDTESPNILGTKNITAYINGTVSYKSGVTVTDNKDTEVKLQIDSSNVNLKKEGTYTVTYSATDSNGNRATKTINVTVIKQTISEEVVYKMVDDILAEITTENMTKKEKAYAIYKWIRENMGYVGTSDKNDWLKEVHRGITTGLGDCFTFYSVAEVFLTRAGIDNMMVTRVGGKTSHFWNLVNCGDGWYHFDSCTHIDRRETFMMTDAEVAQFTIDRGINYYVFDKSLYPRTPEEPFEL